MPHKPLKRTYREVFFAQSPEHIEKRARANRGRKRSPEAIANMARAQGRRRSEALGA